MKVKRNLNGNHERMTNDYNRIDVICHFSMLFRGGTTNMHCCLLISRRQAFCCRMPRRCRELRRSLLLPFGYRRRLAPLTHNRAPRQKLIMHEHLVHLSQQRTEQISYNLIFMQKQRRHHRQPAAAVNHAHTHTHPCSVAGKRISWPENEINNA